MFLNSLIRADSPGGVSRIDGRQQAEAFREGITLARVTQVMGMLRLAPEILQHILAMPDMVRRPAVTERALRPIAQLESLADQKAKFQELIEQVA